MDLISGIEFSAIAITVCLVALLIADMFKVKDSIVCFILSRMVYGYCMAIALCFVAIYLGMCI